MSDKTEEEIDLFDVNKIPPCQEDRLIYRVLFPLRWIFEHITPLIFKGMRRPFEIYDMPLLAKKNRVKWNEDKFERAWFKFRNWKRGRLIMSMTWVFGLGFFFAILLACLSSCFNVVIPRILYFLFQGLNPKLSSEQMAILEEARNILPVDLVPPANEELSGFRQNEYEVWIWICVVAVCQFMAIVLMQNSQYFVIKCGLRIFGVLNIIIYKKSLRLSNKSKQQYGKGKIVNLVAVDSSLIAWKMQNIIDGLVCFLFTFFPSVYFLIELLGVSALPGIGLSSIIIPLCVGFYFVYVFTLSSYASSIYYLNKKLMKVKDNRVKKLTELYNWEIPYLEEIRRIRKREITLNIIIRILRSIQYTLISVVPILMSLVTFSMLFRVNGELDPLLLFSSLGFFQSLEPSLFYLPTTFLSAGELWISFMRTENYLLAQENQKRETHDDESTPIIIENGNFEWDSQETKKSTKVSNDCGDQKVGKENAKDNFELKNINIQIKKGQLVFIVGGVGSGKSSILSAILGEMKKNSGVLKTCGQIAYVAQSPTIFNASLEDNILFGNDLDKKKLERVIEVSSLERDLEILPAGLKTGIGEKGINLSGGQKARTALARSIYFEGDILILDDIFAALDSHVGRDIFENCILDYVKNKTRVVVTNNLQFLNHGDLIIYVEKGEIVEKGSYNELVQMKGKLFELLSNYSQIKESKSESDEEDKKDSNLKNDKDSQSKGKKKKGEKIIVKEDRKRGNIDFKAILVFFKNMGVLFFIVSIGSYVLAQVLVSGNEFYLSSISSDSGDTLLEQMGSTYNTTYCYFDNSSNVDAKLFYSPNKTCSNCSCESKTVEIFWKKGFSNNEIVKDGLEPYNAILIYSGVGLFIVLVVFFREVFFQYLSVKSAKRFHSDALHSVSHSPVLFFDQNPLGRIINRFSSDIYIADSVLPILLQYLIDMVFRCLGVIVLILIITWGMFAVFFIPILVVYGFLWWIYRKSSVELIRILQISNSPVYSFLSESIHSANVIRAYNRESFFESESRKKITVQQRSYLMFRLAFRWVQTRISSIGSFTFCCVSVFIVIFVYYLENFKVFSLSRVALCLTISLRMVNMLDAILRFGTYTESQFGAIERLKYYSNLKTEAPKPLKDDLKANWPKSGKIVFENLKMKYREELDLVLKGINISIDHSEKIGVVGRTGSGKSSLIVSLFRIVEPESGKIFIDDVDIGKIGLDYRSKISVIPQDPTLFSGTIRKNLDPLSEHSDEEIWDALEKSFLKEKIEKCGNQLESSVNEEGSNFSQGEKQLLCFSRAILNKSHILILDECTASVDVKTDDLIQKTIRKQFKEDTVLIIAHRINTIVDCDRILVMDDGLVGEFDTPLNLVTKEKYSLFRMLVKHTGEETERFLLEKILSQLYGKEKLKEEVDRVIEIGVADFEVIVDGVEKNIFVKNKGFCIDSQYILYEDVDMVGQRKNNLRIVYGRESALEEVVLNVRDGKCEDLSKLLLEKLSC